MGSDLLKGGIAELGAVKLKVIELNGFGMQKKALDAEERELQKGIGKKENEISDEIAKTTRQRRSQVEAAADEQIGAVREKLKKVQSDKEKVKKQAVSQRIDTETAGHRNEAQELNLGGKSIFKQEKIPLLYNNRLFFALFFPGDILDIGIILLSFAVAFFVIPFGVYYLLFNGMNALFLALCYIVAIVVFGGAYLILGKTKCRHQEALDRVRRMRKGIRDSKRKQRQISRQIKKDKDEGSYGLADFDREIESLQRSADELLKQKEKALSDFDTVTAGSIKDQITAGYEAELSGMKAGYRQVFEKNRENLDLLNNAALYISAEYEGYLGKENLSVEKIEKMEEIINSGSAATIEEAIALMSKK